MNDTVSTTDSKEKESWNFNWIQKKKINKRAGNLFGHPCKKLVISYSLQVQNMNKTTNSFEQKDQES